jgi:hypothetical protein
LLFVSQRLADAVEDGFKKRALEGKLPLPVCLNKTFGMQAGVGR